MNMKIALGSLVLSFVVISQISCQTFPSNYLTLWNSFKYKLAATDCAVKDFRKPFEKCDAVFGNMTEINFIKAAANFISSLFSANDNKKLYQSINLFCKAGDTYKKCLKDANKLCNKTKIWTKFYKKAQRDHPVFRFTLDLCKDGSQSKVYAAQKPKVDTTKCLKNTINRLTAGVDNYKLAVDKTKDVLSRDPDKSDNANTTRKLGALCSISGNLKRVMHFVGQTCNLETKTLLFKVTQWVIPPEINGKCNIPSDDPNALVKPYGTNNKNRITVFIFGGFHKYRDKATTFETCQYANNENVNILELDKLQMVCTTGALSSNYTYIKSCSVTFFDSNRTVIDSLSYSDSGVMSKTFSINGGTSLGAKSKKGKKRPTADITLTVVNTNKVRIVDRNTGTSITIILFTSKKKVNVYSIVVRLTQSALSSAVGILSRDCINTVNLSPKRGRRAATPSTTNQANYDTTNLNDPNAATMSTNAVQETNSIVATDTVFRGANILFIHAIWTVILPIMVMALFG